MGKYGKMYLHEHFEIIILERNWIQKRIKGDFFGQ